MPEPVSVASAETVTGPVACGGTLGVVTGGVRSIFREIVVLCAVWPRPSRTTARNSRSPSGSASVSRLQERGLELPLPEQTSIHVVAPAARCWIFR